MFSRQQPLKANVSTALESPPANGSEDVKLKNWQLVLVLGTVIGVVTVFVVIAYRWLRHHWGIKQSGRVEDEEAIAIARPANSPLDYYNPVFSAPSSRRSTLSNSAEMTAKLRNELMSRKVSETHLRLSLNNTTVGMKRSCSCESIRGDFGVNDMTFLSLKESFLLQTEASFDDRTNNRLRLAISSLRAISSDDVSQATGADLVLVIIFHRPGTNELVHKVNLDPSEDGLDIPTAFFATEDEKSLVRSTLEFIIRRRKNGSIIAYNCFRVSDLCFRHLEPVWFGLPTVPQNIMTLRQPRILLSLYYSARDDQILVTILRIRDLDAAFEGIAKVFMRVLMYQNDRIVRQKQTMNYKVINEVNVNELSRFELKVPDIELSYVRVLVMDQQSQVNSVQQKSVLGLVDFGTEEEQLSNIHWNEVTSYPEEPVYMWHYLYCRYKTE